MDSNGALVSRGMFGTWRAGRSDWRLQVLSIFSLSVAFVCLAAALLVVTNVEALRDRWSRAGRATVYLKDGAKEGEVAALMQALSQTGGVSRVRRVTSDEARREVVTNDEALAALPVEAFPGSLEVAFDDSIADEDLKTIALKLRALPAVETVETYERWTERLSSLLGGGVTAAACLALIVLAAVISVVGSTMRLLLQRRKIEVEVLRLVGATNGFVRRPFVLEGATQGALGALFAVMLLGLLFLIVRDRFDQQLANLLGITPSFLPWQVALGMVTLGGLLGAMTAFVSLRKLASV
ncbi:MAG: ABC transporter permease [Polyangiaceae bacterium]|nr:ABC transporter permease [Polyangiaceae bacterium]